MTKQLLGLEDCEESDTNRTLESNDVPSYIANDWDDDADDDDKH